MNCLGDWERFVHAETQGIPPLIKAGLLHVQFETIHPFLDGNGRLGRLLITLFLCAEGVLRQPLLYLSLYFKTHRADYYRLLQEVRERGAWEAWLEFFLDGIAETANQAFDTANRIAALLAADREHIVAESGRTASVLQVHDLMRTRPFLTAVAVTEETTLTMPTVNAALAQLQSLGVIREITGRKRGRVFAYSAYLDILSEGAGL
jgi:Fic family protein